MARSTAGPAASRFRSRPRSPVPLPDCRAGFASTAASAEQGIQKTSEGRREWSYCGLSSILHVLGHATTDMRFRRDRADCGDRGLRAQRSPGTGDRIIPRFSIVSCTPPHVPPERSVPCRFAWPLPGGRAAVILFKAINEKSNDATQAKRTHVRSHRPRARSPSRARACPHVDLSRRSQFHARDSRDRRAGSRLERRDPPPGGRGRGRCAVPPDHTPAGPPGPARAAIGPASARVESPYVDVVRLVS